MTDWLGPAEWQAVALSLRVSFWATLVSLPLGIWVAFALARWSFPGKQLLNGIVHLPLILPPVVTGYVLLLTLGPQGPVGSILADWGIVLAFSLDRGRRGRRRHGLSADGARHSPVDRGNRPQAGTGQRDFGARRPSGCF